MTAVLADPVALLWAVVAVVSFVLASVYLWIGLR